MCLYLCTVLIHLSGHSLIRTVSGKFKINSILNTYEVRVANNIFELIFRIRFAEAAAGGRERADNSGDLSGRPGRQAGALHAVPGQQHGSAGDRPLAGGAGRLQPVGAQHEQGECCSVKYFKLKTDISCFHQKVFNQKKYTSII